MLRYVLLCLAFAIGSASAATFTVTNLNDAGAGSLRDAVIQANAAPGSTINFSVTGSIVLTTGTMLITEPVTITGPGAASLTIDGNASNRIFAVNAAAPAVCPATTGPVDFLVSISGLTLRNAHRNTDNTGGAIVSLHSLSLDGMVIRDNAAKAGAGVSFLAQFPNQSLTVTNSQFVDNEAKPMSVPTTGTIGGAAIRVAENCTGVRTQPVAVSIANTLFEGNSAQPTTQGARGGAVLAFSYADISIADSRFVGNTVVTPSPLVASYLGGAMWASAKSVSFVRTEIADNFADIAGAIGFFNDASDLQTGPLATDVSIVDSTISNNTSTGSPIVYGFGNVAISIANSTIVGNTASANGTGGVGFNTGATVPPSAQNALGGTLQIDSSILWNPAANNRDIAKNNTNLNGPMTVNATNSIIGKLCDVTCGAPITVSGSGNQSGVDPRVEPLAFNGGPTRTRGLQLGSPAVDRGSNPLALTTDQRGSGFPRTVGAATDVGAFEYQPPLDCVAFTDVAGSSAFCANVAWIKNRGVTLGCTSSTLYCPGASVIRLAMAAFMNRLGDALTPSTLDSQQVNSPLDLATIPTVCTTGDLAATLYQRRATLDGVFAGIAPSDTFVRLTFRVSTDGGATWINLGLYRALGTLPAAAWHSMRGVGYFDVPAGDQVRFSLRIDRGDTGVGPNLVNESTCHLRVRTENSAGFSLL